MSRKQNYPGIDIAKIIAAFMVIAIHTYPFTSIDRTADFMITHVLCRVAVPFFFMVSGYFIIPKCLEPASGRKSLREYEKKIGIIYLVSILLYLPVNFYTGAIRDFASITGGIKELLWGGTFYHLWYLPALMLGTVLTVILLTWCRPRAAFLLGSVLYVIGLFGDSYYGAIAQSAGISAIYDVLFRIMGHTRNGIFFAPVFLILGYSLTGKSVTWRKNDTVLLAAAAGLMEIEGLLLYRNNMQKHDSMYLFLVPVMYLLFRLLLTWKASGPAACKAEKGNQANGGRAKAYFLTEGLLARNFPLYIYILHPLVIIVVRGAAKVVRGEALLIGNSIMHYLTVCISTAITALVLVKAEGKMKAVIRSRKGSGKVYSQEAHFSKIHSHKIHTGKTSPRETRLEENRAWIMLQPEHFAWNVEHIKERLPEGCEFMAVVKANAYGHGAAGTSAYLNQLGIRKFAVATLSEGIQLRETGIKGDILILGYTEPENIDYLVRYQLIQTVTDYAYAEELNKAGRRIRVHIKIDTGMNRLGESYHHLELIEEIFTYPNLEIEGVYSHLCASAGTGKEDKLFTQYQIDLFYRTVDQLREDGYYIPKIHLQSSYGVINYPELQCDYVRIGIAMYGVLSEENQELAERIPLKPVLSIKARVSIVKEIRQGETVGYDREFQAETDMRIAGVAIGYADGIPRNLSKGGGEVLIRGRRCKIIGKICMDQMMVDVSHIESLREGEVATIIGIDGEEEIRAEEMARKTDTITNELLSRLGERLERISVPAEF